MAFLRFGADPFNHSDDQLAYFDRQRRLPTNIVTALAYDRDNRLLVGTPQGLAYFDDDIDFFFPLELPPQVGSNVTSIAVDSRNNIWVGTTNGLAYLPEAAIAPFALTSQNSDLVSNQIQRLAFDEVSGKLLIFTRGGLSVLEYTPTGGDDRRAVYAYPNPFRIQFGGEARLLFSLDRRGDVRIFTIAGDRVRNTTVNAGWDGRNEGGELVASGVYLFEIAAEDGSYHTGKIFVLRR